MEKFDYNLRPEGDAAPLGVANITTMDDDGDLLIGLRKHGAHPDNEVAIVTIRVEDNGSFTVAVADGDGRVEKEIKVTAEGEVRHD